MPSGGTQIHSLNAPPLASHRVGVLFTGTSKRWKHFLGSIQSPEVRHGSRVRPYDILAGMGVGDVTDGDKITAALMGKK